MCHFLREADQKDEIEITSLFNISQAPIPRKRQEYKGLFIHSVKYQFVSIWSPGAQNQTRPSPRWAGERISLRSLGGRKRPDWTWELGRGAGAGGRTRKDVQTENKARGRGQVKKSNKQHTFNRKMELWPLYLHDLHVGDIYLGIF